MAEYLVRVEVEVQDAPIVALRCWTARDEEDDPNVWCQIDLGPIRWNLSLTWGVHLDINAMRATPTDHAGAWIGLGPVWVGVEWRHKCWVTGKCEKDVAREAKALREDGEGD